MNILVLVYVLVDINSHLYKYLGVEFLGHFVWLLFGLSKYCQFSKVNVPISSAISII